jgi:hypothetical protein
MADKPKFMASLQPQHHEKLKSERAAFVQRELSETYDVRAQRHFNILEAGGDPHDEEHRHAFVLHRAAGRIENDEEKDNASTKA